MIVADSPDLAELQWLRRLALALVDDRDDADELAQQTVLIAWERAGQGTEPARRGWLAGVLRNRFRMLRRAEARRRTRELAAAEDASGAPDVEHGLARVEVLRQVIVLLERLSETDRELVMRRYFDDEDAAQIAASLGVPAATVRSRLLRVLARVRAGLDQRHGGKRDWALVLFPSASWVAFASSTITSWSFGLLAGLAAVAIVIVANREPDPPTARAAELRPALEEGLVAGERAPPKLDPTARLRWSLRHADAELARRTAKQADDVQPEAGMSSAELRAVVDACVADLGGDSAGVLALGVVEVGAPDVGTIIESIDVIAETVDDAELVECVEESMYGFVGRAPAQPYRRSSSRSFTVGEVGHDSLEDERQRTFDRIVAAHATEVGGCQQRAGIPPSATLTLELGIDAEGRSVAPIAHQDGLAPELVECVLTAARRWKFPTSLSGRTYGFVFELPIPWPREAHE